MVAILYQFTYVQGVKSESVTQTWKKRKHLIFVVPYFENIFIFRISYFLRPNIFGNLNFQQLE